MHTGIGVGQQGFAQLFFLGRIGGKALGQRQLAADFDRIERVIQRIVKGINLRYAKTIHNAFQRHALPFLARIGLQEDALQVIPAGGPAFVQPAEKEVLLEHRHIVKPPLGKFCVGAGPFNKTPQPLGNRHAGVQVPLGQACNLGNMMLQFAEDARAERHFKGIKDFGPFVDPHGADLDDFAAQRKFRPMVLEGTRRIADVPFKIKHYQIHAGASVPRI